MAERIVAIIALLAGIAALAVLVWITVSIWQGRREAEKREREFASAMRELERAADTVPKTATRKEIQQPKPQQKPVKRFTVRRIDPKVINNLMVLDPDKRDRDKDHGRV